MTSKSLKLRPKTNIMAGALYKDTDAPNDLKDCLIHLHIEILFHVRGS